MKAWLLLSRRSRRNNLHIDGIHENPNETWDLYREEIQNVIIKKLGIVGPVEIERCHRMVCN